MEKKEKSEIEKLGERLQKKVRKKNRDDPTKDGRKTMSIMEMGRLLGLKKTDSYWLANKHYFRLIQIRGRARVDIESFEKWYANQIKYQKVDGPPPGEELRRTSYSPRDISQMLGICEQGAYDLIKRENLPVITVDYWKRVPAEDFEYWYAHQDHYRVQADRKRDARDELIIAPCFTVADLIKEYVELYGKSQWALSTYTSNVALFDNYILPTLGNLKLTDVTTRVIEQYYRSLLEMDRIPPKRYGKPMKQTNPQKVSPNLIREIHKLFSSCFKQGVRWEIIDKNPCQNATRPKVEKNERDIWTLEDLQKALDVCDDENMDKASSMKLLMRLLADSETATLLKALLGDK